VIGGRRRVTRTRLSRRGLVCLITIQLDSTEARPY
jgi:hypothetical protein